MRITAIEPQQKNPQRVNIYLDGEFAFGLAKIVAAWLKVGQELDEARIARLKAEDERETVYQKALHFLSYRPRSSAEVRQNLTRRGVAPDLVEATIARLQENGLLDDGQFARLWVENRSTFRPRSRSALTMELRQKGLEEQAIQSALEAEAKDEEELVRLAARKQARRYAGLAWPEFRRKLGGFLARRGFSYATFAPVLSEVWQEIQMAETGNTSDNKE
jgi:regulatory protein